MGRLSKLKLCMRSTSVVSQLNRKVWCRNPKQDLGNNLQHSGQQVYHTQDAQQSSCAILLSSTTNHDRKAVIGSKQPEELSRCSSHASTRKPLSFHISYGARHTMIPPATHRSNGLGFGENTRSYGTESSNNSSVKVVNESSDEFLPVDVSEIKSFLAESDITFSDGHTCISTSCAKHRGKKAFRNKVYINMTTGYFVCLTCGKSGNWSQYKDNTQTMLALGQKDSKVPLECLENVPLEEDSAEAKQATVVWEKARPLMELPEEDWDSLQHDLQIKGLEVSTLDTFKVRALVDSGRRGLVIPLMNNSGAIIGVKTLAVESRNVSGKSRKTMVTRTIPRVNFSGLFGLTGDRSKSSPKAIITSNEFDAMAVHQATGRVVFSLPKSDSILPQKVLPYLEKFKEISLWLGGDAKTWESAKQFARKLNESRCYLIRPSVKHPSALSCLQRELSISSILRQSHPAVHKSIISFKDLRRDVYDELSQAEQVVGVKWKRYPQLNKLLKGHRRGELTVFTGPTGAGKTTFISDYSLDLALQGVNTLWGSFEINNVRLMKTMLTQFSQTNLSRNIDDFDHWADKFEELPIYFMTFHGQEEIRSVIETMSHAVYVHDIAHVVVDNLQFMMGVDDSVDRFVKQDKIITAFRRFATNNNCHVTIVVHPRKERDTEELTISSIFGSAKASQEADNILILQDKRLQAVRGKKYIQVAKNRFDGDLGVMMLEFDKDALSFAMKKSRADKSGDKTKGPDLKELLITDSHEVVPDVSKTSNNLDWGDQIRHIHKMEPECVFQPETRQREYPSECDLDENLKLEIKEYSSRSTLESEVLDYVVEDQEATGDNPHSSKHD